jgi:hypothetical protein
VGLRPTVAFTIALAAACGSEPETTCGDGGRCASADAGLDAEADAGCANVHFTPTYTKPSVELLLDRSGSMAFTDIAPTRFGALRTALTGAGGAVTTTQTNVYFGAALFAGDESPCPPNASLDGFAVPRALDNAASIDALIQNNPPGSSTTPTAVWISAVANDFGTNPPPTGSPPIILLATDGIPNSCSSGSDNGAAVAATQAAYAAGVRTFVIGLAGLSTQFLQDVANAGTGKPIAQPPGCTGCAPFYTASDATSLASGLAAIVGGVISCDLAISGRVDANNAFQGVVTMNGNTLTYGTDWTVDPSGTTLQLLGSACDTFKSASNPTVDASFPCAVVVN